MATTTLREHLSKIRDGFRKIETITRKLSTEPAQETLESALRVREVILCAEVENRARELSAACPDWNILAKSDPVLKSLLNESEDLVSSIVRMDERIASVVNKRMGNINTKLRSLYSTSRAANSYTRQSTLRVAR
jgi:hypothetical protein